MHSSAVLFLLSYALWQFAAANDLFKIAVEGQQTELKCWTNHTLGVDWILNTTYMTKFTAFYEGIIPNNFNDHYSVERVKDSNGELFHLSIRNILSWHAGIYECIDGLSRSVIARTELIVISSITCNYTGEDIYLDSFCSFTVSGNTFMRLEWSVDSCANDTRWFCNGRNSCEAILSFNNNNNNNTITRTLPVRFPGAKGHWTSCNATSLSLDNDAPNDSWINFTKVFRFKVSLRCSQNPTKTQTTSAANGSNSSSNGAPHLWVVLVVVGPLAGSVLTFIIIVIACKAVQFGRRKERKMIADTNASEFGTIRMTNINREDDAFYEEISDLNATQVVSYYNISAVEQATQANAIVNNSYYNISAVEQATQANAIVNNSIPRSTEIDYRANDGYLQEGVGVYSEVKRLPPDTE